MAPKPKFRPKITRVKLNPEQAVLTCNCYSTGIIGDDIPGGYTGCYYDGSFKTTGLSRTNPPSGTSS